MSGENDRAIILLAFAGACVDAASYFGLGRIFTANMSGNTIVLVLAVARADLAGIARSGVALVGYILGVVLGELVLRRPNHPLSRRLLVAGLILELLILIILCAGWLWLGASPPVDQIYPLIVLSAVAMGIQSTVAGNMREPGVGTTYITGMIIAIWSRVTDWLEDRLALTRAGDESIQKRLRKEIPILPAVTWIVYLTGALAGGLVSVSWHALSLLAPILAVGFAIVFISHPK